MPIVQSCLGNIRAGAATRRSRRFFKFIEDLPRPLSVVDLGGSAEMWRRWGVSGDHQVRVTLINNHHIDSTHRNEHLPGEFIRERMGDVLNLSRNDLAEFDVVFSNSMMEHLSSREDQARLAARIIECGKPFFIQVPNKHCIVDPHFPHPFAPFFAMLPRPMQARLLTMHPLGSGSRSQDFGAALKRMQFYTPIGRRDLAGFFPGAAVEAEWSMGLPISIIASQKSSCSQGRPNTEACTV